MVSFCGKKAIRRWSRHLLTLSKRRKQQSTVGEYQRDVSLYSSWCLGKSKDVSRRKSLRKFVAKQGWSDARRNRFLCSVKSHAAYCHKKKIAKTCGELHVDDKSFRDAKEKWVVSLPELDALWAACGETPRGRRDRLLLATRAYAWARCRPFESAT